MKPPQPPTVNQQQHKALPSHLTLLFKLQSPWNAARHQATADYKPTDHVLTDHVSYQKSVAGWTVFVMFFSLPVVSPPWPSLLLHRRMDSLVVDQFRSLSTSTPQTAVAHTRGWKQQKCRVSAGFFALSTHFLPIKPDWAISSGYCLLTSFWVLFLSALKAKRADALNQSFMMDQTREVVWSKGLHSTTHNWSV